MSNFEFMDDPKFLRNHACARMYKNARVAESMYRSWRVVCAVYARQTLEDFCAIVSELKGAVYPEEKRLRTLGWYWCGQNREEFIQIIGPHNFDMVWRVNSTARSYIHCQGPGGDDGWGPVRDDCYPELLEDLYNLLLWLYKELGLKTKWTPGDYSPSRIPEGGMPVDVLDGGDLQPTPERALRQLRKAFPNCNTENLCNVERDGGRYLIRDLQGGEICELPAPEVLEYSQEEIRSLRAQMDRITREFEGVQAERAQLIQDKEERIQQLEDTVKQAEEDRQELTENQKRETEMLREKIRNLEASKGRISDSYREKLGALGREYDVLNDKYQALLPVERQRDELRLQVKRQMELQAAMVRKFSAKQDALRREIADTGRRLEQAQLRIQQMNCSEADSQALIKQLQGTLAEKDRRLQEAQEEASAAERRYQREIEQILQKQGEEAASAAIVRMGAQLQSAITSYDRVNLADSYLQVASQSLAEIDKGLTLYNADAERLRRFFGQVRRYYGQQIDDLNDQLTQAKRELDLERRRNAWVAEPSAPAATKQGHRVGYIAAALCLLLVLGLTGYTAVNQWHLQNTLNSVLAQEDGDLPESEDPAIVPGGQPVEEEEGQTGPEPSVEPDQMEDPDEPEDTGTPPEGPDSLETDEPAVSLGEPEEAIQPSDAGEEEEPPPVQEEADPGDSAFSAQEALEALQTATDAARPPDTIADVPGVNSKLLDELENMDWDSVRIFGEKTQREHMYFIGEAVLPGLVRPGSTFGFITPGTCFLSNANDNEVIQFGYTNLGRYEVMAAAEISDLSDQLSRGSTLEEVSSVLGTPNGATLELDAPTIFTDAETETAVIFQFGKRGAVAVLFDENGTVCDYVLIHR